MLEYFMEQTNIRITALEGRVEKLLIAALGLAITVLIQVLFKVLN